MNAPDPLPINAVETSDDVSNLHEDPITHAPGAHPVSTGLGAAGMGAAGAAIGVSVAGPVGGVVGAVVGAVAGGLSGKAVGESLDPTQEAESWPGHNPHIFEENERRAP